MQVKAVKEYGNVEIGLQKSENMSKNLDECLYMSEKQDMIYRTVEQKEARISLFGAGFAASRQQAWSLLMKV